MEHFGSCFGTKARKIKTKLYLCVLRTFFRFGLNVNNHKVSSLLMYFAPIANFWPRNRRFTDEIMFIKTVLYEKLISFCYFANKCKADCNHVTVLDQFLSHIKFHMRLDKICYTAQTFVGQFFVLHPKTLKKSKLIIHKHHPEMATKAGMLIVSMP